MLCSATADLSGCASLMCLLCSLIRSWMDHPLCPTYIRIRITTLQTNIQSSLPWYTEPKLSATKIPLPKKQNFSTTIFKDNGYSPQQIRAMKPSARSPMTNKKPTVSGKTNALPRSYLRDRYQGVLINNSSSNNTIFFRMGQNKTWCSSQFNTWSFVLLNLYKSPSKYNS